MSKFDQAGLLAQPQHLHEQLGDGLQVTLTEIGNRVVVRVLVAAKHAERYVLVGSALNLARGAYARAIPVKNDAKEHLRVITSATTVCVFDVRLHKLAQVRRQEETLVEIEWKKAAGHSRPTRHVGRWDQTIAWSCQGLPVERHHGLRP